MSYNAKRKVISLGGSIIYSNNGINIPYCLAIVKLIKSHPNHKFLVVIGGGTVAREYIRAVKEFGIDKQGQDLLGIESTRLNAQLLALLLSHKNVNAGYVRNVFEEHPSLMKQHQVIVTGGTIPGHTTDRVSVQCATKYGDKHLVNVTSSGGIFDDDPKKNSSSRLISQADGNELIRKWGTNHNPGMNLPIEPKAVQEALEMNVTIHIIGEDIEDLKKALFKKSGYKGTKVLPE